MLVGLGGAAVPLIIHLLERRRAPEHAFPAVELLLKGRSRTAPHRRLRRLLVLLARMLVIILFAGALALPFLRPREAEALSGQPIACVILLDDTLSMQYRADAGSLFDRAKNEADSVLSGLRSFDRARVITLSGRAVGPARFSADLSSIRGSLRRLEVGYGHYRARPALRRALEALARQPVGQKLFVVLSDLTRSSWEDADLPLIAGSSVRVVVPDLLRGLHARNRHIQSVELRAEDPGMRVDLTVAAIGKGLEGEFPCWLELEGGTTASATAVMQSKVSGRARFSAAPGRGWFAGRVRLPEDPLAADNVHYLCGRAREKLHVLLVDGDPRESIYRSESFYLDLALRGAEADGRLTARTIPHEQLPFADLGAYDCLILANVPASSLVPARRIQDFVRGGGGLWVLPGDQVDAEAYTRSLGALLCATPVNVGSAPGSEPFRLSAEDAGHPIFGVFGPRWLVAFGAAEFRFRWLLVPAGEAKTVLAFGDGAPALAESAFGRGRVLVMAGPLDRDWNDLCIQPVFVPFVHQCVRHLCGALDHGARRMITVGETFGMEAPEGTDTLYVLPPGEGSRWRAVRVEPAQGGSRLAYTDTRRPGIYRVATEPRGEALVAAFAVNVDPRASDLRRVQGAARWRRRLASEETLQDVVGRRRGAVRLWPALLWLALLALLCESVLARR